MNKSPQSLKGKEKSAFWLLNPASKAESILLSLFFLLLPTQLGKHFWPDFTIVSGIRIDYLSPTIYTTDVLLVLLFSCFGFRWIKTKKKSKLQIKNKKYLVFGGLIILFFFSNILFSARPPLSLYDWLKFCEMLFLGLYLSKSVKYRFQLLHITFLFSISALCESLLAISQYLTQGSLNGIFYFFGERAFTGATPGIANAAIGGVLVLRPYATFSHPNVLAGYLLVSMVMIWNFLFAKTNLWTRFLAACSLVISSIALLVTFSRVVILLWGALLLFVLLKIFMRSKKSISSKFAVALVTIAVLGIVATMPIVHEIFTRFVQTSLTEESVVERTELLSAAWKLVQQHPFVGVGLNNFIPSLAPLQKPLPLGLYLQPVHNIFILLLAETGIIGLGLIFWFLVLTIKRVLHACSYMKGPMFVLLLVIVTTGMFDHYWLTLQQGQLLLATIVGMSWTMLQKTE